MRKLYFALIISLFTVCVQAQKQKVKVHWTDGTQQSWAWGENSRIDFSDESNIIIRVANGTDIMLKDLADSISFGYEEGFDTYVTAMETQKLPIFIIATQDAKDIVVKDEWLENTSFTIINLDGSMTDTFGKIKGRGNATWSYPKKPYSIKFSSKQELWGFAPNKNWALLAEYCDRTLLRAAYTCAISKATGIEYTVNYQPVILYLNGEYRGVYVLTDKVEKAKDRIDIEDDGYIIEDDNDYVHTKVYFITDEFNRPYSFKYPDPDTDITKGDDNYLFIRSFMNQAESALLLLSDNPDDTQYQEFFDLEAFAKYYIASEVLLNFDPNRFYVLPSKTSKLMMMPLWDWEWSMGLWPMVWGNPPKNIATDIHWDRMYYFKFLFLSPAFRKVVKEEWKKFKSNVQQVRDEIEKVRESIAIAQIDNYIKWPQTGQQLNVRFDTWEQEVDYVNQFFEDRIVWMDEYIASLAEN